MLGIIFSQLKKCAIHVGGEEVWKELLDETGNSGRVYLSTKVYSDEDAVAIAVAAAKRLGKDVPDVLEAFGSFMVTDLIASFGQFGSARMEDSGDGGERGEIHPQGDPRHQPRCDAAPAGGHPD